MNGRTPGFIGAALLAVGVFMPIVGFRLSGSINYFQNGHGDGAIVMCFALLASTLPRPSLIRQKRSVTCVRTPLVSTGNPR